MPKETFQNLPEEKKSKIIDVAIDEFAQYTYHKASISRIVEKAGIAKGSFYQYFEDKNDLFKHILNISAEKKLKYLTGTLNKLTELSFFQIVRELYLAGIRFGKDSPKLSLIANDFMKNSDQALKAEIMGSNVPKSNQFFVSILQLGIQKGEIDPNIDIDLVAYILTSFSISIGEYFFTEVDSNDDMEIMVLVDRMLNIIENGIKVKED